MGKGVLVRMKYRPILAVVSVVVLLACAILMLWWVDRTFNGQRVRTALETSPQVATATPTKTKPPIPVPAFQSEEAIATLPPTLNPEAFTGSAHAAYAIAKEIPGTLAQIPCYCHCDRSEGHRSLHSCFVTDHGSSCGICMNEAMRAYKLKKEKRLSDAEIREAIIREFGK